MPQVTTNAPMNFVGKSGRDNPDGQSDHDQPCEDRCSSDNPPQRRDRHHVAIANRAERDDGPPHRAGNRAEFLGLDVSFDKMHGGGSQKDRSDQDDKAAKQRSAFGVKNIKQGTHARRIACEF